MTPMLTSNLLMEPVNLGEIKTEYFASYTFFISY